MHLAPATASRLLEAARRVRDSAYAPYSRFRVGAAALAEDGRVFVGCNVENSSFGLTICAERNAVAAAVAAGARPVAVAIVADTDYTPPCGACRQVLAEFSVDMPILLGTTDGSSSKAAALADLLPSLFRFDAR
jgi:cytidine deaminase